MTEFLKHYQSKLLAHLDKDSFVDTNHKFELNLEELSHRRLFDYAAENNQYDVRISKNLNPSILGNYNREVLQSLFDDGHTIVIQQIQNLPALRELSSSLEQLFDIPISINAYISPPNCHGFPRHWDQHDVIVIQTEGSKHWLLDTEPCWNVLSEEVFHELPPKEREEYLGRQLNRYIFQLGTVAYIPRGTLHEVYTDEHQHSVHLAIGLTGLSFFDKWKGIPAKAGWSIDRKSPLRKSVLNISRKMNFESIKAVYNNDRICSVQTHDRVLHVNKQVLTEILKQSELNQEDKIIKSLTQHGVFNGSRN